MKLTRRSFLISSGALAALASCDRLATLGAWTGIEDEPPGPFEAPRGERIDLAQHVLQRCTFGLRPGDRTALLSRASDPRDAARAWFEEQLEPQTIDDARAQRSVRRLDTLSAPIPELYEYHARVLLQELTAATLLRAVMSKRQLYEVMVEFWSDHFNIDSSKGECAWLKAGDDRGVIRAHALGSFRKLLKASAFSPAMLWYLDGRANVKRTSDEKPNENYARELLELHTLGVRGGYTQRDVMEAARCLSGWSVRDKTGLRKATVEFHADAHDDGEKEVLGARLPARSGERDAHALLELVARHPSTATHLATKLCRRFIAEEPPAAAVDAVAAAFRESDGDIAATLRVLFAREEFLGELPEWSHVRGAKLKRPFHFLASILRATDAVTDAGAALTSYLTRLGHAPFQYPTPDGYPIEARAWQGALFWRWKLAGALADGHVAGTSIDARRASELFGGPPGLVAHLLGRRPDEREERLFLTEGALAPKLGLVFASPAFQRC